MATSDSKGGGPKGDPRQDRQSAIAQLLSTGALTAQQAQADLAFKEQAAQQELARSIADAQQKHAATLQKNRMAHQQKLGSKYIQLVNQGRQADAKYAQAQAARQGQQPSAQEVLAGALKGTEVENINPTAPVSRGRFDVAGTGASEFMSNFGQPGGPQPGSPVAGLPRGAGPEQALQTATPSPAAGGAQGPSLQVGGQTFQAPPEITRRVAELGAQPIRMTGGFSMAPTFSMQSITEPNVLTAGEVMAGTLRQREIEGDMFAELIQYGDAEAALTAARALSGSGSAADLGAAMTKLAKPVVEMLNAKMASEQALANARNSSIIKNMAAAEASSAAAGASRAKAFKSMMDAIQLGNASGSAGNGAKDYVPGPTTIPDILQLPGSDTAETISSDDLQNRTRGLYSTVWGTDTHEIHPSAYSNGTEIINAWMARDQFVFLQPSAGGTKDFIKGVLTGNSPGVGALVAGMFGASSPAATLSADNMVQLLDLADPGSGAAEADRKAAEEVLISTGGWRRSKAGGLEIDSGHPLSAASAVAAEAWRQKIIELEAQLIEAGKLRPNEVVSSRALREYEAEVRRQQRLAVEIPRRFQEAEQLMQQLGVGGGQPAQ